MSSPGENYAALVQAAQAAAEAAQQRLALLVQAGELLAGSHDHETALQNVARVAVPHFADWCTVYLASPGGAPLPIAIAAADPAVAERVREVQDQLASNLNGPTAVGRVIATGQPLFLPQISEEAVAAALGQPAPGVLEAARALGAESFITVPLVAGGRTLGAMAFTFGGSGRRYTFGDVGLAEHLARFAAIAIENARLIREAVVNRGRLEAMLEQLPVGVVIADVPSGQIIWNSVARQLYPRAESTLEVWQQRQHTDQPEQPYGVEDLPLLRALQGESTLGAELSVATPGGGRTVLLVNAAPLLEDDDAISGAVVVLQDITQRKTLEDLQDEFVEMAAHQLKTPLTIIKGSAQLLLRRWSLGHLRLDARDARTLEAVGAQVDSVVALIDDLIDLSSIQLGDLDLRPALMDLAALLRELIERQQTRAPRQRYVLAGADRAAFGTWDRQRLAQAFGNLLDNASKFSPEDGVITVQLQPSDDRYRVTVDDQGIGIPPGDLPHIFERRFRASNVGRDISGLGLGLYLAAQIIEGHGGTISAQSQGRGASFTVELPRRSSRT